jgi:SMI1 / KNR4 family (SUKH-1)
MNEKKYDWEPFLRQWNAELMASKLLREEAIPYNQHLYPPAVLNSGWLGYPGATEEQLTALEIRLGTKLPPSYRQFLAFTNGWRIIDWCIPQIWSSEQVDWVANKNPEFAEMSKRNPELDIYDLSDEEYLVYDDKNGEHIIRSWYIATALEISDRERHGTAQLMLNPLIISDKGEWEAFFYAHWIPVGIRFRTFWDLMQYLYRAFSQSEKETA